MEAYVKLFFANRPNTSILVVDDETTNRELFATCLQDLGFGTVLAASNGREALDTFRQQKDEIILVVSDIQMPVMGGDELFWHLKSRKESVRVLLCSGNGFGAKEFLKAGLNGFLRKPFTFQQFSLAIVNALI